MQARHVPPLRPGDDALPDRRPGRNDLRRDRRAARELRGAGPFLIARILIWSLDDSLASLDELRPQLPDLPDGDLWISNDVQERIGLLSFGDELPDLGRCRALIGKEPDVAEEFDVE